MNVYDFDKTIYKNDSTADFFLYCLRKHPRIIGILPSICAGFIKYYIFRKGTKTQFKEKIFKFVNYIDYEKDISEFWNKNKDKIKDFYIKQQQKDDVIISASPRFVLAPICKELGIDNLICSEVDVHSGKYNGENCHGEEKVLRFRAIYKEDKVDKFYSDSRSDTPMALISAEPFIIKGNTIKPWN